MERLILRSVLWGADKVPDHWFERVPGGFYQSKDGKQQERQTTTQESQVSGKKSGSRHLNDNNTTQGAVQESRARGEVRYGGGNRSDHQQRRNDRGDRSLHHRAEDAQRPAHVPPRRDEGVGKALPRNSNGSRIASSQANHSAIRDSRDSNHHKSAYPHPSGGLSTTSRNACCRRLKSSDPSPQTKQPRVRAQPSRSSRQSQYPQMERKASAADGYVPYAHIYGGPPVNPSSSKTPQAKASNKSSAPVIAPPDNYHQNPNAQLAPTAADAGAGAAYTGQNGGGYYGASIVNPYAGRGPSGYDGEYSHPGPSSQSPNSDSSYDSDYDRNERVARTNAPRRSDDRHPNDRNERRSKSGSRAHEAFDTSQRGLGYGAVGALAGGLVGSEVGKGKRILPMAIGATVGALGANAFEARERRKDTSRHEQFSRDGTYDRGAERRYAEQHYHRSD